MQKVLRFAALLIAGAAFPLAPGANLLKASPAISRLRHSTDRTSSHSAKRIIQTSRRRHGARSTHTSAVAPHSTSRARHAMRLTRYSPPPQQPRASSSTKKKKKIRRRRRSRRQSYQKAPTPERISEIQSALARGGYYQGDPNGKWDSNTVNALQKFQSANGMEASGKLDAPSLQKMGLGSDIAGVSAPKPLPPAGSAPPSTPRPPSASFVTPPSVAPSSTVVKGGSTAPSAPEHADSSAAPSTASPR